MKKAKLISLLLLAVMVVTLFPGNVAKAKFSDLAPNHWCYEKIMDFNQKGWVDGYLDGSFRPEQTITRAEYTKMVNNFFGYPLNEEFELSFTDIKGDEWFAPYVREAVKRGYIKGFDDNTFRPSAPITRQEATVILSRILEIDDETYPKDHVDGMQKYSDGTDIDDWAYKAIHSYSVYGFISGYLDGTIKLRQNVLRSETVELLNRLEEKIEIDRTKEHKHKVRRVQTPIITVYEQESGENKVATSWVNYKHAFQNPGENMKHAMVEITCPTEGAEIHYTVDGGEEKNYDDLFPVYEGEHQIEAYAIKSKMANSTKANATAKVDTVAPHIAGIKDEDKKSVKILIDDFNKFGVNKISGLDKASVKLAWFTMEERVPYYPDNEAIALRSDFVFEPVFYNPYIRETKWMELDENGEIEFPTEPGIYFLGAKAKDIAGNWMGAEIYNGHIDNRVDIPSGEDDATNDPYIIVTENEIPEDGTPVTEPSGDITPGGEEINPGREEIVVDIPAGYTVEHYLELLSGDYELKDTEDLEASVNSPVTATKKDYEGYHFNVAESFISDYVARDGSTKLIVKYDRNINTINYIVDDEIIESGEHKFGEEIPPHEPYDKQGYDFVEWSGEVPTMPNEEVNVEAIFEPSKDTPYKVEHYLESLSGDYVLEEEENMTGTTGESTKAEANEYDGFTMQRFAQKIIAPDGSTVVEIYYTRNLYLLTYMLDGEQHEDSEELKFEEPITPRVITVAEGYHFSGWNPELPETMPDEDVTVSGEIIANTDTKYRYEYLLEDLTDTALTYTVAESGEKKGTTDAEVELIVKDFEGFTFDSGDSRNNLKDNIAGDGKLVLRAYYKRNSYTLTYKIDGKVQEPVEKHKFDEVITLREEPTKDGYTFIGWSETAETLPTMPARPVVIEGSFTANKDTKYKIEYYLEDLLCDEEITYTLEDLEELKGETDTLATIDTTRTFEGFTFDTENENNVLSGNIAGDGKLVLKAYYSRNSHWLTYLLNGEQYEDREWRQFGDSIDMRPNPDVDEGYHFSGWEPELPETMPDEDVTVSGEIIANTDTKYRYEYLLEDLTDTALTYTVAESGEKKGTTDAEVELIVKDFEGFAFDSGDSRNNLKDNIAGDGSTVLRAYYKRNSYTLTYKVDGKVQEPVENHKFEEPIIIREEPTKDGYTFSSWSETAETLPTMPAENVTIEGTFKVNEYTLAYYVDGVKVKEEYYDFGEEITPYVYTVPTGYKFSGWTPEVPKTMPAEDTDVYGKLMAKEYDVIYYVDGEKYAVETHAFDSNVEMKDEPTKDGHTFSGWTPKTIGKMPAHDVEVRGTFTENLPVINIDSFIVTNFPNGGKEAEPGDEVAYKLVIENEESRNVLISVDIVTEGTLNETFVVTYIEENGTTKTETLTDISELTIPANGKIEITFTADIDKDHAVNSKYNTVAEVSAKGKLLDEATVKTPVEKSATIVGTNVTGKNVVLVLDLSGSMDECVTHGKKFVTVNGKKGHAETNYWGGTFKACSDEKKIDALKSAAKDFIDQLEKDSSEAGSDITLTLIGIGNDQGYDDSGMRNTDMGNQSQSYAYKMGFYTKGEFEQAKTMINGLSANGGTNITGALKLVHTALQNNGGNGITFIDDANEYVVLLTDGANGTSGQTRISDSNADANYIRDNSTLFAIAFGTGATAGTDGYNDLKAITADEKLIYSAASSESLKNAFDSIATLISKEQSVAGEHVLDLPADGKYFPVIVSDKTGELFRVNTIAELVDRNMEVADGKLIWDITGTEFSDCVDLKIKLTLTDGTNGVPMGKMMMVPLELVETELISGDTEVETKNLVSGEETKTPVIDETEKVSGEDTEEVPTEPVEEPAEKTKEVSGETIEEVIDETSEVLVEEIGEVEPLIEPEKQNEGEDETSTESEDENTNSTEDTGKENTTDDVEAILAEKKKEEDEEEA